MPTPDATVSTNGSAELTPEAAELLRRLRRGDLVPAPGWLDTTGASPPAGVEPAPPAPASPEKAPAESPPRPVGTRLVDRLPPSLRDAVVDPSARGAAGLGIVALLAALVAVVLTLRAAPSPVPVSAAPSFSGTAPAGAGPAAGPGPAGAAGSVARPAATVGATAEIVVDVAGKVRNPGVVSVPAGGRVADALRRAGGVLPGTDTSALSLARKLTDGEQILVTGEPGPAPVSAPPAGSGAGPTTGDATGGAAGSSGTAGATGTLDLNAATQSQLEELPGVGPVLAERILAFRTEHNGFASVDQLAEIKGLGGKTGQELMGLVRVG